MPRSTSRARHFALDVEGLLVGGAQGADHAVERQVHLAALQPFLQLGLGSLAAPASAGLISTSSNRRRTSASAAIAGVEVDRADQRLQRIGQDGRPLAAAGAPRPRPAAAGRAGPAQRQLVQGSCLTRLARTLDRSPSGRSTAAARTAARPRPGSGPSRPGIPAARCARRKSCGASGRAAAALGSWKRCCRRPAAPQRVGHKAEWLSAGARVPVVLEQQEGRAEHVEFLVVGEGDHTWSPSLAIFQVLALDRRDVVDLGALSKMLRTPPPWPSLALLIAFSAAWYSRTDGNACAATGRPRRAPPTMKSTVMKEMPRCALTCH
jgi:hypothetical protein